jgi:uncharacterized protein (DUF2235 family)
VPLRLLGPCIDRADRDAGRHRDVLSAWRRFAALSFAARTLDEMFAWYLSEHIMDGYKFLMQNYHEGDSVCIFGLCLRIEN